MWCISDTSEWIQGIHSSSITNIINRKPQNAEISSYQVLYLRFCPHCNSYSRKFNCQSFKYFQFGQSFFISKIYFTFFSAKISGVDWNWILCISCWINKFSNTIVWRSAGSWFEVLGISFSIASLVELTSSISYSDA